MSPTRYLGTVAACAVLALTSACGGSGNAADSSKSGSSTAADAQFKNCTLTGKVGQYQLKTVQPDVLTIKADLPSAGWWNGDTIDQIDSGYEYCLAAEIAHLSGLKKIDLQNVSFDKLVSGTLTGYDLSLDEISITPDRQKIVDFSDPYYTSYIGVLTKQGSTVSADTLRNMTVGVKEGTAAQQWVHNVLKPTKAPRVYPGDAEALAGVVSGQVDAYLQDAAIELGQAKQSGGQVQVTGQYKTDQAYGAMLPKGSNNLTTINKIIDRLKSEGYLDKLSTQFLGPAFGGDPTTIPVWTIQ
ncbi:MAG: ABC transporter substrate-binding protein [Mycobacteriaceae bacterium]